VLCIYISFKEEYFMEGEKLEEIMEEKDLGVIAEIFRFLNNIRRLLRREIKYWD